MFTYDDAKEILQKEKLPLAFVDMQAFDANADAVAEASDDLSVRVVTKSLRCRELVDRLLDRDGFEGVMCYSGYEAEWIAEEVDDVLVAYPVVDQDEVEAAADADATLMVDSFEQMETVAEVAPDSAVCVDLDVSSYVLGQRVGALRSSLTPEEALDLAIEAEALGLEVRGVMGYDAQVAGLPDSTPNRSRVGDLFVSALKKRSWETVLRKRREARTLFERAGFEDLFFNGGGTGSLHLCADDPALTEVALGSAFYYPALFDHHDTVDLEPAAGYAVEVSRQPEPEVYTCRGGGYVASGPVGPDKQPQPYLPRGAKLTREGAGEVQTPIRYRGDLELGIGDPVVLRHSKAGELCERFRDLHLVSDAETETTPTYRGEGRCFL